jgi:hypothetical protein
MSIQKNVKRKDDSSWMKAWKNYNSFMQRFLIFEYNSFRNGLYAAVGRGGMTRTQGATLMAAVSARMGLYTGLMGTMSSFMYGAIAWLFGFDYEDEEPPLSETATNAILSTFLTLTVGRDFGTGVKNLTAFFIEKANKAYGEDLGLRKGEYDPYKNSLQYNIAEPSMDWKSLSFLTDVAPNLLGAYSPLIKTLEFGTSTIYEELFMEPKKTKEAKNRQYKELWRRLPLEIGGHLGFVPAYKDLRKLLLQNIYKDLKEDKSSKSYVKPKKGKRSKAKKKKVFSK